jgi:serine/threonine protein kinase
MDTPLTDGHDDENCAVERGGSPCESAHPPRELNALRNLLQTRPKDASALRTAEQNQIQHLLSWIHSRRHLLPLQESVKKLSADELLDWQLGLITLQLQEVVSDYHYAFLAAERPVIRDYVAEIPVLAQPLFTLALITKDVELRTRRAEIIRKEDYTADFPELVAEIRDIIGASEADLPALYGDRYRLRRHLRHDLAGNAYEADDRRFRRAVIVRFLEFADYEEFGQFHEDCWKAAKFRHPHLIQVYDQGISQGRGFVVHELLTGEPLLRRVQQKRPSLRQAVKWCLDIADLLAAAESSGQVPFCDLRPQQFLITPHEKIKLLNSRLGVFPACQAIGDETISAALAPLTSDDCPRRTPANFVDFNWSSPEQLAGDKSPLSPVFQLGALLYYLLTDHPPFPLATTAHAATEFRRQIPLAANLLRPEVPSDLARFCERTLAWNPADRPRTVSLLRDELMKFSELSSSDTTGALTSSNAQSSELRPTMTVPDRYVVDKLLGQGGWAEVWRAQDTCLRRDVALKLLRLNFEEQHKRFAREARMSAALKHPLIVDIYDHGTFEGQAYIAYELIHGRTLTEEVAQHGLPEPKVAAEWCRDIARAIQFAHSHEKQVVHRDLTPNNIMITADRRIKVLDFGLAIYMNPGSVGDLSISHQGGKRFRGTYRWTSPEQLQGFASTLSDIHGIGSLLYFLLTGDCPFGGSDFNDAIEKRQKQPPSMQNKLRPVPERLEEICFKALETEPQLRHSSAAQLADDLDQFLHSHGQATSKPSLWARIRSQFISKPS